MVARRSAPKNASVQVTNGTTNGETKTTNAEQSVTMALSSAATVRNAINAAKRVFIEREEALDAFGVCLCAGEHLLFLSKPGLAKSAIAHWVCMALGCDYFWTVLNPDTLREDLVGPISINALNQDRWDRKWSGMATAHVALVDEVGKASNQVLNMLLNMMEERKVQTPDGDHMIPLHCVIGASNETLDGDVEALWDRFTVRLVLQPIRKLDNFRAMLVSNVDTPALSEQMAAKDFMLLRQTAAQMAVHVPDDVLDKLCEIKVAFETKFKTYVSDRRWRRILRVSAGHALYQGRTKVQVQDLVVAKWMLWTDVDDGLKHLKEVYEFVADFVETGLKDVLDAKALAETLLNEVMAMQMTKENRTKVLFRQRKLMAQVREAKEHLDEWQEVQNILDLVEQKARGVL